MGKPKLSIVPLQREPWKEMVDYLREKLAQAERGELAAIAVVTEYADGSSGHQTFHGEHSWPMKLIGELAHAQHAMHQHQHERRGR